MTTQNFTTSIVINKSPQEVFDAINNVGSWWSLDVRGESVKPGDEFETRFGDVHYSRQRITESVPGSRIVWLVTDSNLTFLDKKDEWTGTEIIFEIGTQGANTLLHFTHVGLVPGIECYSACSPAWSKYMQYSLRPLIESGKGQPGFPPSGPLPEDYSIAFTVDQKPEDVFKAILNVWGWWSEDITGSTARSGDEFYYHYKDIHKCAMKLEELILGERIAWLVTHNHFNFVQGNDEWTGTKVCFDISVAGGKTKVLFTHYGLLPQHECYEICSNAWKGYITDSLKDLIATGKGQPNPKE